jgi:hypothetical protein
VIASLHSIENKPVEQKTEAFAGLTTAPMQKTLLVIGLVILLIGLAWPWLSQLPLGRLPGDLVVERDNFRFFLPVTTMILVSALLTLLAWLFRQI